MIEDSTHSGVSPETVASEPQSGPDAAAQHPPIPPGQEIVAMIVHELRGPLATMSNVLDVYRADPSPATHPSARDDILARQLQKALRLVDDLLDASRLARQAPTLATAPVDLSQVIKDTVRDLDHEIRNRQQRLILNLPARTVRVQGDGMRLGQIVANLLENSSKYSAAGGQITLSLAREGGQAVLCIRDNGIGIASEDLPHIFDSYYRASHPPEYAASGFGLGLTLARRLVELHGGMIEAKSNGKGCGSEFTITLPALAEPP